MSRRSRDKPLEELPEVTPDPITLEDHTCQENKLWAEAVEVSGYDIVGAERGVPQPGSYVSWLVTVRTRRGAVIRVQRRYSEFDELRSLLAREFTQINKIPELPSKSFVAKFDSRFLEQRRRGLEYFLRCTLLDPTFADSFALRAFVKTH